MEKEESTGNGALVVQPPQAVAVMPGVSTMALEAATKAFQDVRKFVASILVENHDYGQIPGTQKPTLYQPGAQKIIRFFMARSEFTIVDKIEDYEKGLFDYNVRCDIIHIQTGNIISSALGSANTYESGFRWRQAQRKCPECGQETIFISKYENKETGFKDFYCYGKKGGCGAQFAHDYEPITSQQTGRVQNPDIADQKNSCLKRAEKRAQSMAALNLGCISDLFTQDLEDFQQHENTKEPPPKQPEISEADHAMKTSLKYYIQQLAELDSVKPDFIFQKLMGNSKAMVKHIDLSNQPGQLDQLREAHKSAYQQIVDRLGDIPND
ncbi:MAG: hypothetical protein KC483_10840 [Nitrosarchaeum sp.]|nr:hypothetical protein [Nitrosarchaeum sp.]